MKIKNVSGVDRLVPGLGSRVVFAGQVVEVDDVDADGYLCQPVNWISAEPVKTSEKKEE